MRKIIFLPKKEAERIIPCSYECIISMRDPGEKVNLHSSWDKCLTIECDDLDPDELKAIGRSDLAASAQLFTSDHAREILDFVLSLQSKTDTLYVHCKAGVSRSAAVAIFLGTYFDVPVFKRGQKFDINENAHIKNVLKEAFG